MKWKRIGTRWKRNRRDGSDVDFDDDGDEIMDSDNHNHSSNSNGSSTCTVKVEIQQTQKQQEEDTQLHQQQQQQQESHPQLHKQGQHEQLEMHGLHNDNQNRSVEHVHDNNILGNEGDLGSSLVQNVTAVKTPVLSNRQRKSMRRNREPKPWIRPELPTRWEVRRKQTRKKRHSTSQNILPQRGEYTSLRGYDGIPSQSQQLHDDEDEDEMDGFYDEGLRPQLSSSILSSKGMIITCTMSKDSNSDVTDYYDDTNASLEDISLCSSSQRTSHRNMVVSCDSRKSSYSRIDQEEESSSSSCDNQSVVAATARQTKQQRQKQQRQQQQQQRPTSWNLSQVIDWKPISIFRQHLESLSFPGMRLSRGFYSVQRQEDGDEDGEHQQHTPTSAALDLKENHYDDDDDSWICGVHCQGDAEIDLVTMHRRSIFRSIFRPRRVQQRKRFVLVLALFSCTLLIVLLLALVVFPLPSTSNKGNHDDAATTLTMPQSSSASFRMDQVIEFVTIKTSISNRQDILSSSTPQYKAAQWIADIDELQLEIPETSAGSSNRTGAELKFLHRYIVAVLWFSLGGSNYIGTDENTAVSYDGIILQHSHICDWRDEIDVDTIFATDTMLYSRIHNSSALNNTQVAFGVASCKSISASDGSTELVPTSLVFPFDGQLVGTIPKELMHLNEFLETFILQHNPGVGGKLPASTLQSLTNLKTLSLDGCSFSGTFPKEWIFSDFSSQSTTTRNDDSNKQSFRNLSYLDLSDNLLTGTIPLQNPSGVHTINSALQVLDLQGNFLTTPSILAVDRSTICEENVELVPLLIRSLPNLKVLNLGDNLLEGTFGNTFQPFPLSDPNNDYQYSQHPLVSLDVGNNFFSSFIPIELFSPQVYPNLTWIDLSSNRFTGHVPHAKGMLTHDDNDVDSGVNDTFPRSTLEVLQLQDNEFSGSIPSWIGHHLLSLKYFDLSSNQFTSTIPSSLLGGTSKMTELKTLIIGPNPNLQKSPIPSFAHDQYDFGSSQSTNTSNETFQVVGSDLSNTTQIWTFSLTDLDLTDTNRIGSIPASLGYYLKDTLEFLALGSNRLSGTIPDTIGLFGGPKLRYLLLDQNQLSGTLPTSLDLLSNLDVLLLHRNNFTGDAAALCRRIDVDKNHTTSYEMDKNYTGSTNGNATVLPQDEAFKQPAYISSDCGGNMPEIDCTCCALCCQDGDDERFLCSSFSIDDYDWAVKALDSKLSLVEPGIYPFN